MRYLTTLVALLILTSLGLTQTEPAQNEKWFFDLDTPGGPLPIEIEPHWRCNLGLPMISIRNGEDSIDHVRYSAVGREADNQGRPIFALEIPGFQSELIWSTSAKDRLVDPIAAGDKGRWTIDRRSGQTSIPLTITQRTHRFPLPDTPPAITSGRYRVTFASSPDDPAVGLFTINDDGTATGTFLTTTGDYRYLAGNAAGDTLKLSTFDGAHAFLFHAERQEDGALAGDFWSGTWWHDTWTAVPDPDFRLPDPFAQTKYRGDAASLERLSFTDLDGTPTPVGALAPHGSPRIVEVFGSWCPNCHDATRLLSELHANYKDRGLVVLGLAFEHSADDDKAIAAVRTYKDDLQVDYPLLIAGLSDKQRASEMLPVLDRVRSFPTTLFIDADGDIRAVHSGFSGPATGDAHTELREQFIAHIEAMLAEHERQSANEAEMPTHD